MLLKTLTELNGASGNEKNVRDYLRQQVTPLSNSVNIDKMGNLISIKNGASDRPRILLAAHMDEVALMITDITPDGFLKFRPVGGIDPRILISKPVKIGKDIVGVIGSKAIHLQKPSERKQTITIEQLYIDIGTRTKDEANKNVKLGDYAYFMTDYEDLGDNYLKAKAFDDRIGCAALVETLKNNYDCTVIAAFTVQEEVGLRGAKVAAFHTDPDFAIVLEGTVAADMIDVENKEWVTEPGKGPACSIMDRTTLYNPKLIQFVDRVAKSNSIPLQFRRGSGGGNDAGRIHLTKAGIPTISLSVPCRYIHSCTSVVSKDDYHNFIKLIDAVLRALPSELNQLKISSLISS
ncbi:MAG: M42 family metallopeptidase [Desulfitobacterium hafniense]|nr:M42 family metallopeptidase [Desulfitobacterium hafniense]